MSRPHDSGAHAPEDDLAPHRLSRTGRVVFLVALAGGGVLLGLGVWAFFALDDSKERAAAKRIKELDTDVESYKILNGAYPESLEELLILSGKPSPPRDPSLLLDPWNHPYHYDVKGPRNGGKKPDIWSDGGGRTLIGNWPKP